MNAGRCVHAMVSRPAQPMAHALDAAREPGVEVRLDDADGDREVGLGHAPGRSAPARRATVVPRSARLGLDALCVDDLDPRRRPPAPARRARSSSPVVACRPQPIGDGDGVVGHAGRGELVQQRLEHGLARAGPGGVGDGDDHGAGAARQLAQARRRQRRGQRLADGVVEAVDARQLRRRLEGVGTGHGQAPRAAPHPGGRAHDGAGAPAASREARRQVHHIAITPMNGSSDQRKPRVSQSSRSPCVRRQADQAKSMQMTSCGP